MQQVVIERARRLISQGLADERVEEATGLSLAEIVGLRAERAACAWRDSTPPTPRKAGHYPSS